MSLNLAGANYRRRRRWDVIARHLVINFFVLVILLPLAWVLLLSIKSIPDAYTGKLLPEVYDFTHYAYVIDKIETLPRNLFNSIYVTGATVLLTCTCAVLGGYALVHLRLPGQKIVVFLLIASLYFPCARGLVDLHLRDPACAGAAQHDHRADLSLCHPQPGHQHPDHAQHLRADSPRTV